MGDYVIVIKIHRDIRQGILGISQETYIKKVLERFQMKDCSPSIAPIVNGDKFHLNQCPKNDFEREKMKNITYAYVVGSLMYSQKAAKKVLRYLKGTKDYMLTYKRSNSLEVVGYSDSDFDGCVDLHKSTSGYIFMFASGAISWRSVKQSLTSTSIIEA
ncbi:secreted RxLR effector protein 161-like [Hibiscus syriacus]|uniref:secreted RxLR effector protein 161-like n=1 Tax=Hibiscus syriacus TaxID=106335 RepID=UPI0019247124|nr:secreted RxLR effector protein 161-like [Hibiscus syriacus]